MTSSQIDRLGERLKLPDLGEADLRALDDYRRSFAPAYEIVLDVVRERLGLQPTGRSAKSTPSIVDKLRRESIRLSQMQDIAGCRLVVPDISSQDHAINQLRNALAQVTVVDRRVRPSHGYRAVHLIVKSEGKLIEVQIRTEAQHFWAEISEKLADKLGPALKYGNGPKSLQVQLEQLSNVIATQESAEAALAKLREVCSAATIPDELRNRVSDLSTKVDTRREAVRTSLQQLLASLPTLLAKARPE